MAEKADIVMQTQDVARLEEISWRQKSRFLWLKKDTKILRFSKRWQTRIEGTSKLRSSVWLTGG